jgi:hypothetical protein|tara:strand:- start:153 stop:599 length:447 start_codon:yes stop_codon:yes gene_type:complete
MRTPNGIAFFHDDHGLGPEHLLLIDTLLSDWDGSFIGLHVTMPEDCPSLPSDLHGPSAGDDPITEDEVEYVTRANRAGPSRLVSRESRPCREMVLIAGPGRSPGDEPLIYTAYGSQVVAPREPWDKSMNDEERAEARAFWSEHALSAQ